jgi:hypothetical protein
MTDTTRRVREFFGGKKHSDSDPNLEALQKANHKVDFFRLNVNFQKITSWARKSLGRLLGRSSKQKPEKEK